jgi:hypothetical protein
VAVRRQARVTLTAALVFALAAPASALLPHRSGRWLPLHLFLGGAVLLAISGAAQFFAVTWAAGPAPSDRLAAVQRGLLAAGAVGVAVARDRGWTTGVAAFGAAVLVSLALLGWSLAGTVRRAVQRRFDVTLAWYLTALTLGVVGVSLGIGLACGVVSGASATRVRSAHVLFNLLGLVGLVVGGTLPFFVATQAKMRMSVHRARQRVALVAMAGGTAGAGAAILAGAPRLAGVGLCLYLVGLARLAGALPRPGRRQLAWAGPRLVQLGAGLAWWAGAVAVAAALALAGRPAMPGRVVLGLVIGGYAQILAASLAYLGPVLAAGGHERLAAGFAAAGSRLGLVAGNVAAVAAVSGKGRVAGAAVAIWCADTVARERRRRSGP